jgi:phytanoyl-CoA hydroxylase
VLTAAAAQLDLRTPLEQLERDGYARLGRVLDAEGLEALRERAEDLMLGRVVYEGLFFQLDATTGRYEDAPIGLGWQGPSLAYRKLEKLEKDARFRAWLNNPLFERAARAQISGDISIYRAILFNKGAAAGSDIPWHQDGGDLWGLSTAPPLQIWTALDPAPLDGGCLEFLPGSHRSGLATPLGGIVPRAQVAAARAAELSVKVPVEAGEALLIHNDVWHRSGRNRPGQRRLAFSVCYMSAATRCLRKRRAPRQFFSAFERMADPSLEDFEAGGSPEAR